MQMAIDQSISRPRVRTLVVTVDDKRNVLRTSQKEAGLGAATATNETEETWSGAGPGSGIRATEIERRQRKNVPPDTAARGKSVGVIGRIGVSKDKLLALIMIM